MWQIRKPKDQAAPEEVAERTEEDRKLMTTGDAGFQRVYVFANHALALDVCDRDAAFRCGDHDRRIVSDRVSNFAAKRLVDVRGLHRFQKALFKPVHDDAKIEGAEILFANEVQLTAGAMKRGHT